MESRKQYAQYCCGELEKVVSEKEMLEHTRAFPDSEFYDFVLIFDGHVYDSLSQAVCAQIATFGWQLGDDRLKSHPGGNGPMCPDKLRKILKTLEQDPYSLPNDYYAWEKPDGTLFMLGTNSSQMYHVLVYQYDPFFHDYSARQVDIDNIHVAHMRGNVRINTIEELVAQVADYKYLGTWRDPAHLIDDPYGYGRILATGRWELAKEKILNRDLSETIEHVKSEHGSEQSSFAFGAKRPEMEIDW